MTAAAPLWVLFFLLAAGAAAAARWRRVGAKRVLAAWILGTAALWGCAALFGMLGFGFFHSIGLRGLAAGALLGALAGAPLGIWLSERIFAARRPSGRSLVIADALLLSTTLAVLLALHRMDGRPADPWTRVAFPLLGAAAVLGWLAGERS